MRSQPLGASQKTSVPSSKQSDMLAKISLGWTSKKNNGRLLVERYFHSFETTMDPFEDDVRVQFEETFKELRRILKAEVDSIASLKRPEKAIKAIWIAKKDSLVTTEVTIAQWIAGLNHWFTFIADEVKKSLARAVL